MCHIYKRYKKLTISSQTQLSAPHHTLIRKIRGFLNGVWCQFNFTQSETTLKVIQDIEGIVLVLS